MPFLRLTRDRRGFENTFLLHADRPGDRPRLLYWYRTAPGIGLGRSPLDEDAIRTIEDNHPDIEFDWPAILALSEVMTPEDEAPARPTNPARKKRRSDPARTNVGEPLRSDDGAEDTPETVEPPPLAVDEATEAEPEMPPAPRVHGLLEELVGREIATRLRGRYSEIMARIHEQDADPSVRDAWARRAEALNPDLWLTPDAVLAGVRAADGLFEQLRAELASRGS